MAVRRSLTTALVLLLVAAIPARASSIPAVTVVDSIRPGSGNSWAMDYSNSVVMGGWLYFGADDGTNGRELWRTNGETTEMMLDINPGADNGDPQGLYVVGSTLFFSADDGSHGHELWQTDGTLVGTTLAADINPEGSSYVYPVGTYHGNYYFGAADESSDAELWSIDPATLVVTEHEIAAGSGGSYPQEGINYLDYLYFVANDATNNRELWRTDGTVTEVVFPSSGGIANPTDLVVHGGFLYVTENLGNTGSYPGRTMYKSAGTLSAVTALGGWDIDTNPTETVSFGGQLYFAATDSTYGQELWASTGANDHRLVADIQDGIGNGSPQQLTPFGDWLYFSADDGVHGRELYRSNGMTTSRVADIRLDGSSWPQFLTPLGEWLYFQAYEPVHGAALYRTRGTVTERVPLPTSDLTYNCDCYDTSMVSMGERLFFTVRGDLIGQEFAFLDEPTYSMPSTDRAPSSLAMALLQLAALTAAVAVKLRRGARVNRVE